jgi:hypothetical protein
MRVSMYVVVLLYNTVIYISSEQWNDSSLLQNLQVSIFHLIPPSAEQVSISVVVLMQNTLIDRLASAMVILLTVPRIRQNDCAQ